MRIHRLIIPTHPWHTINLCLRYTIHAVSFTSITNCEYNCVCVSKDVASCHIFLHSHINFIRIASIYSDINVTVVYNKLVALDVFELCHSRLLTLRNLLSAFSVMFPMNKTTIITSKKSFITSKKSLLLHFCSRPWSHIHSVVVTVNEERSVTLLHINAVIITLRIIII